MTLALLLTATIDPGDTPRVVRRDVDVRLAEYRKSFAFYASVAGYDSVVLAENSGFPMDELASIAPKGAELVATAPPSGERLTQGGQALGEMTLIQAAFSQSNALNDTDVVVKLSGRLPVRNIEAILSGIRREEADVWCSLRRNLTVTHSVCFAGRPQFFKEFLLPQSDDVDEIAGRNFETILVKATLTAAASGSRWRPLPARPHVIGIRAADGARYNYSWPEERVRDLKHAVYRKLLRS